MHVDSLWRGGRIELGNGLLTVGPGSYGVKRVYLLGDWKSPTGSIAHFRVAACLSFKASPGAQPFKWKWVAYSYANQTHFPYNSWAPRLTSKPRQTATRKWPIQFYIFMGGNHSTMRKSWRGRVASQKNRFWVPETESCGLFFQKSWNFSGLILVPQFPLYLRNAEVLILQTSQSSLFFLHQKHVKASAFQNKHIAVWRLAFRARKVLGTLEKQAPGWRVIFVVN